MLGNNIKSTYQDKKVEVETRKETRKEGEQRKKIK